MSGRLLWVGDAGVSTGFARATHKVCDALHATGQWDIEVVGINYVYDPDVAARHPYIIHPAKTNDREDPVGINRLGYALERHRPDVVVILNDPWFMPLYKEVAGTTPIVAWLAVDGRNLRASEYLSGLRRCVFWTEFALEEARSGGLTGPASVVPLGVDLELYRPLPKAEARKAWNLQSTPARDGFIVGNINRNQPRKRLENTIDVFATWVLEHDVRDAFLMLHLAPTGEHAIDIKQLMGYYGLNHRLILSVPPAVSGGRGISEASLAGMYSCFDAMLTTTQGEGFGLTTFEAAAAGVPIIAPAWSALGELLEGAAELVPCSTIAVTAGSKYGAHVINPNVIGGVVDRGAAIAALHRVYTDEEHRRKLAAAGMARVAEERFRWDNIGARFHEELEAALTPRTTRLPEPADAGDQEIQGGGPRGDGA